VVLPDGRVWTAWPEPLDLLVAVLQQTGTVVSLGERDRLRESLVGWGLPTGQLDELTAQR
jgi:hypothetical protein